MDTQTIRLSSLLICFCLLANVAVARETISVRHDPVDHAKLDTNGISKSQPVLVTLFDTANAKLGKAKHRDVARMLAKTAPHILAADIVTLLRDAGFTHVFLEESEQIPSGSYITLKGEFTQINPGSQAARAWIGFGAGKSRICIKGRITSNAGTDLADFSDCRSGIGWGESSRQMNKDTDRIGQRIAELINAWAEGSLN